jgi:hypothetical protein
VARRLLRRIVEETPMKLLRVYMPLACVLAAPCMAFGQTQDHLTCFAVRDSSPRTKYQVTITTEAGSQSCIVRTPAKTACVQAAKSQVTPPPPGGGPSGSAAGSFLCYRAKCARPASSRNVVDQFGQRVVSFRASRFLCAPADLNAPPPGSSTTTTSTLPGQPGACRFENGECRGTCALSGQNCRAVVGTGDCECTNVACGDADTPECNGGCSSPGEACLFDLNGCSCVDIP